MPAAITALNPAGSKRKWSGGELVLVEGGIVLDYRARDIVLINGSQLHGVLPIVPKPNTKCATRFSLVHFARPDKVAPYDNVDTMCGPSALG